MFEHRTGHRVDGLEWSLQAASSTREKRPRQRRGVDGLQRMVAAVGGVDRQGSSSNGRPSPKREPKGERFDFEILRDRERSDFGGGEE